MEKKIKFNYLEFKNKILDYFKDLPSSRIDQEETNFSKNCGCCVGSHIFYIFKLTPEKIAYKFGDYDYEKGASYFYEKLFDYLHLTQFEIEEFFSEANLKDISMFGYKKWSDHPYKILKKMFEIMDGE